MSAERNGTGSDEYSLSPEYLALEWFATSRPFQGFFYFEFGMHRLGSIC